MPLNTGNPYIDALGGDRWADPLVHITFDDTGSGGAWLAAERAAFTAAFQTWSDVANVTWVLGVSLPGSNIVERKDTAADFTNPNTTGQHRFPSDPAHLGRYNTDRLWSAAGMVQGGITFLTLVHEIGHAIGMAHPHDNGMGTGLFPGVANSGNLGQNGLNAALYTVMSYNVQPLNAVPNFGMSATPMAFDVAAIQTLYGATTNFRNGNDSYALDDADLAGTFYSCIWDTGGIDEIVYFGNKAATIDLRSATLVNEVGGGGFLSSVAGVQGGFTIAADATNVLVDVNSANGVIIENATGGAGDDTITGNGATNFLRGGLGKDVISGGDGRDRLFGDAGADTLDGEAGADILRGDVGDDVYIVDTALDKVFDSAAGGLDTVLSLANVYRLVDGPSLSALVENLAFIGVGTFDGTGNSAKNWLLGGTGNDTLHGLGGNDLLEGGRGIDEMQGGTGNDIYIVDRTLDIVIESRDVTSGLAIIFGGIDTVRSSANRYTLLDATLLTGPAENLTFTGIGDFLGTGNSVDNRITGGAGADRLFGLDGDDLLDGGAGADTLTGGTGNDVYIVDDTQDRVVESRDVASGLVIIPGGIDTVRSLANIYALADGSLLTGPAENLVFIGNGNFSGTGNSVANVIVGKDGDDSLNGQAGADLMTGGLGNDSYFVDDVRDRVIEEVPAGGGGPFPGFQDAASASDTIITTLSFYDLSNIFSRNVPVVSLPDRAIFGIVENLTMWTGAGTSIGIGNDSANVMRGVNSPGFAGRFEFYGGLGGDQLFGGIGPNGDLLDGGSSDDILSGRSGADLLRGGLGADTLDGGGLIDTADYSLAGAGVILDIDLGGTGGEATGDVFVRIENVTGSSHADQITGNAFANLLAGNDGNDILDGGVGNDTLAGGDGRNLMFGGNGNDTITGGATFDDMFGGIGHDLLTGGGGQAAMDGGDGNDTLVGSLGIGNSIIGGLGNDDLTGGMLGDVMQDQTGGDDTMHGGGGADSMVDILGVNSLFGEAGDDLISDGSTDATLLDGGADDDTLFSSGGNDTLLGGTGDDMLEDQSGLDSDVFTGGTGADIFVYRLTNDGGAATSVTDFEDGIDLIGIRFANEAFINLVVSTLGADAVVTFVGGFSPMTLIGMAGLISQADFIDLF